MPMIIHSTYMHLLHEMREYIGIRFHNTRKRGKCQHYLALSDSILACRRSRRTVLLLSKQQNRPPALYIHLFTHDTLPYTGCSYSENRGFMSPIGYSPTVLNHISVIQITSKCI